MSDFTSGAVATSPVHVLVFASSAACAAAKRDLCHAEPKLRGSFVRGASAARASDEHGAGDMQVFDTPAPPHGRPEVGRKRGKPEGRVLQPPKKRREIGDEDVTVTIDHPCV